MKKLLATIALVAGAANANAGCSTTTDDATRIEKGMALAMSTHAALERSGARAVILTRADTDLSSWGMRWSHLGIAYRDSNGPGSPVWYVVHHIVQCTSPTANLYRQGIGDFYMAGPYRYEAAYAVLRPDIQARLVQLLRVNRTAALLHHFKSNVIGYPWSTSYQQENQWVLETLAAAASPGPVGDRGEAQEILRKAHYTPSTVSVADVKRVRARGYLPWAFIDDQPEENLNAGRLVTTTADGVLTWTARMGFTGPTIQVPLGERSFFLTN